MDENNYRHGKQGMKQRMVGQSKKLWLVAFVAVMLALGVGTALAGYDAPGDRDAAFGGDGKVTTDFGGHSNWANDVAIQADGKVVAVGWADLQGNDDDDFALARYTYNGGLDSNFNVVGRVTTDFGGHDDDAKAVAIQTDGKIVVGGTRENAGDYDFALARYNPDGTLDVSFAGNGKLATGFGASDGAEALAIQADGKIVAVGWTASPSLGSDFALARYNPNGTLDTTFSGNGKVVTDFGGVNDEALGVAIQANGKIVVVGSSGSANAYDFALARYNSNGSLDTTFGFDGKVTTDFFGHYDESTDVVIQSDGKIVAAGMAERTSSDVDFALARYLTDGTLDTTFGGNGKVVTDFGDNDIAYALVIQPNGKLVAAGDTSNSSFALARYNPGGTLDTSFSGDGLVTTYFGAGANAVALQADGKIVAAGGARTGTDSDFGLARYQGDTPLTPTPSPIATFTPTRAPTHTPTAIPPSQTPGGPTATPVPSDTPAPTDTAVPVPTSCPIQFTDVSEGSTFYDFVRCLACRGIINGYADGTFKPTNLVTRGQLSKIVSNAAGFIEPAGSPMFEDVAIGSTFYDFVQRLASRGYIGGYPCGGAGEPCGGGNLPYFRPNANATRGQISKIVSNAAGFSEPGGTQIFEDVPPGSTFYDFIERLASRGYIGGYPCGGAGEPCGGGNLPYFRPNNNATRGQTSKIVANTFFPNCQTPNGMKK